MTITTFPSPDVASHPQTTWDGQQIVEALLAELPEATSDLQRQALGALQGNKYSQCKVYPCLALDDAYIKAIGYMSSIPSIVEKKMPTLPTLVAEGCRAIADAWQQRSLATDTMYADGGANIANTLRLEKLAKLEKINTQVFAKVLEG
ncbi:MAG: hypothetical protein WA885_11425 [Phormidesmis sp.]